VLELISIVLVFFACSATARAAGRPSIWGGIVGGTIYSLVLAGSWLVWFVLLIGIDRSALLVFAALGVIGTVSTAVAAVDFACASKFQVAKGAITRRLGRTLNVLWLVVALATAVLLIGRALSTPDPRADSSYVLFVLGLVMLVIVPLLTLFVYRTVDRPVAWRLYVALSANVMAAAVLVWYIAMMRGTGEGAVAISAAYYSAWSALAACGNVASLAVTIHTGRNRKLSGKSRGEVL
jgi:hypothetical protein